MCVCARVLPCRGRAFSLHSGVLRVKGKSSVQSEKKKYENARALADSAPPLWVVAYSFFFCTAACSDRCALPILCTVIEIAYPSHPCKQKAERCAGFLCQRRLLRLFWYMLWWEARRCVCPLLLCAAGPPVVPDAVGLPAGPQVAPAQCACALPFVFYEPPSRHSSSKSLRYCCCRRRMVPASRGHVRLCTVCICKREHSTQRSCVL